MNKPWSLVFNSFKSLSLAHVERSLFSLSKQTVLPTDFIFFDNDSGIPKGQIVELLEKYCRQHQKFEWRFDEHHEPAKMNASYAQNKSIKMAKQDTFIFTKADCVYAEDFCEKLLAQKTDNPMEFVAPWMLQMNYWSEHSKPHEQVDHAKDLEGLNWREDVRRLNQVPGQLHNHAWMDAPNFCTTKQAMERAGWYDEALHSWTIWQLDLQSNMHKRGINVKVIEEVLVFHMQHPIPVEQGERDLKKAHEIYDASPRRKDPAFQ